MKNVYCEKNSLTNEAAVESFFVLRLLKDLGYSDDEIRTKERIDKIRISQGRRKVAYRPDFVVHLRRRPRLVIDAKAVGEDLSKWDGQCGSYCHELNKGFDDNPVQFFLLTSGTETRLYQWDLEKPLLTLSFGDFRVGNKKFTQLRDLIGKKSVLKAASEPPDTASTEVHHFRKGRLDEINALFVRLHNRIYKGDAKGYQRAFAEMMKLIFLKQLSDKEIHANFPEESSRNEYEVPASAVKFSIARIERIRREGTENPVAEIDFPELLKSLEDRIAQGEMKRVFGKNERLTLKAETVRAVVEQLEHIDLYSLEADLKGRLFETFLGALLRGKGLGQFFTPRSTVKLMVALCRERLRNAEDLPLVLDPCCGSGGFLIDALWEMWQAIDSNAALTKKQKNEKRDVVRRQKLIGIDMGDDPNIARIARMNMFVHGDGGSRIYHADALDKKVAIDPGLDAEAKQELRELKKLVSSNGVADLILTNPPFSKEYSAKEDGARAILDQYEIAKSPKNGRLKPSVRTSILFFERYWDLLNEAGRVVAIVDDSLLSGKKSDYREIRDFIRHKFVIEAVISLPGDAFQRAEARVKTSVIVLRKKHDPAEDQPHVFMYPCAYVGVDDSPRQRILPEDEKNRRLAQKEVEHVAELFVAFKRGEKKANRWSVPAQKVADRFDVKSCLYRPESLLPRWRAARKRVFSLSEAVEVLDDTNLPEEDRIVTSGSEEEVNLLSVKYRGTAVSAGTKTAGTIKYPVLFRVHEGDLVISHINAVHGAIALVPPKLDGCVVSPEYTICRIRPGYDPHLVWLLARSPQARADLLLLASGMGRTRVRWDNAQKLRLAMPSADVGKKATDMLREAEQLRRQAAEMQQAAIRMIYDDLGIQNRKARRILKAFKPPK